MRLNEIERLSRGTYTGGRQDLAREEPPGSIKPLPGGSRYVYAIEGIPDNYTILILDPALKQHLTRGSYEFDWWGPNTNSNGVVAKLDVYKTDSFPIPAWKVGTITVDEKYRGQGLAMALYGIVLTVQKRTLVAGDSQTPGGRKNWLNLASIPGCEVKGYLTVRDDFIYTKNKKQNENDKSARRIDTIMELGCDYLGSFDKAGWENYTFSLPVTAASSGKELINAIRHSQSDVAVYDSDDIFRTGLYAQWTGK